MALDIIKPRLTLEEVKSLKEGEVIYLEQSTCKHGGCNGFCTVVYRPADPDVLYLQMDTGYAMHKFPYDVLDDVYDKYWNIYRTHDTTIKPQVFV